MLIDGIIYMSSILYWGLSVCVLLCFSSMATAQAAALPTTPAAATEPALTLQAAVELAQHRSASLQAQEAAKRAALELSVSAAELPDPVLRLSVDNLPVEGAMRYSLAEDFMTMRSVGLSQRFTTEDKRLALSSRYQREAEVASSSQSLLKTSLKAQTAKAWFSSYYQQQLLALLQAQRNETLRISQATEASYSAGRLSQAEVLAAHAAVAQMDNLILQANAELGSSKALLQRWIGEAALQPLAAAPMLDSSSHRDDVLAHDINQHPDIALLNARERVAQADVAVAEQEKNADWSWSLMYSKRGSQFGDMLSLGVSIPLQWDQTNRQNREVAAKVAQLEQLRFERDEVRRQQQFELQRLQLNWRSNLSRLQNYDHRLLPLAAQRVEALLAAFGSGTATLAEVLDAQRMLINTRLEKLSLEQQTAAYWAELEYLFPAAAFSSAQITEERLP
jgi:outer membrane protein TolC